MSEGSPEMYRSSKGNHPEDNVRRAQEMAGGTIDKSDDDYVNDHVFDAKLFAADNAGRFKRFIDSGLGKKIQDEGSTYKRVQMAQEVLQRGEVQACIPEDFAGTEEDKAFYLTALAQIAEQTPIN